MTIDEKVTNNLRLLSCAMITNAKSGHSGIALGAAPILYSLYSKQLNVLPKDPSNFFRDRFVLSAGHGSSIYYATLHALGFPITKTDLLNFRKLGGLPGHPEKNEKIGVDCSTGPLGQGVAIAVGMALGERMLASRYNKPNLNIIDHKTFVLVGEGCLMEGVSFEALSLAGNLKLSNLVVVYDCNQISLDGSTKQTFNIDIKSYMKSIGFNVFEAENGNSLSEINNTIALAKKSTKPAFVIVNTKIGHKSPFENSHKAHGAVLSSEQLNHLKSNLKLTIADNFELEKEVQLQLEIVKARFSFVSSALETKIKEYKRLHATDWASLQGFINGNLNIDYKKLLTIDTGNKNLSSREMGGIILNQLAALDNFIIGGTADVSSSTKAYINDSHNVGDGDFSGKNILYGVREFAMSCISAGLALMGFKPFASTFLVFSDYFKNSLRLNALMGANVAYILTHDSVMVGEDGPTHQPAEQIESLRLIPDVKVFRPCSFTECLEAYIYAFSNISNAAIILTRQNLEHIENANYKDVCRGGYVISQEAKKMVLHGVIIATGSEVALAIAAQKELKNKKINVRVVSMLSQEIFEEQAPKYKAQTLPAVPTVCIEAGSSKGWYKYADIVMGIDHFGDSAKGEEIMERFKINTAQLVDNMRYAIKSLKKR